MNYLLIEDRKLTLTPVLNKIKNKFPTSSVLEVTCKNCLETFKTIKTHPLLSNCWCLIINPIRMGESHLKNLLTNEDNVNVVYVESKKRALELESVIQRFGVSLKIIDTTVVSKSSVISYIIEQLDVDDNIAKYIANRHRFYLPKILESIEILKTIEKIDKTNIAKYTERSSDATFQDVLEFLLGYYDRLSKGSYMDTQSDRFKRMFSLKRKKVVKLVYRYKKGFDFLLKWLQDELNRMIKIHAYYQQGELTKSTLVDFYEEHKGDSLISFYSKYRLERVLDIFENVSLDYMLLLSVNLEKISPNTYGIIEFLNLLKLGG